MKKLLTEVNGLIGEFKTDSTLQLEKGNKAAGVRARKAYFGYRKTIKRFP